MTGIPSTCAICSGPIRPGLYTAVFAGSLRNEATQHMPGLAILVAGGLMALGFCLSLRFAKTEPAPQAQPA